jgi:hypothetical protein
MTFTDSYQEGTGPVLLVVDPETVTAAAFALAFWEGNTSASRCAAPGVSKGGKRPGAVDCSLLNTCAETSRLQGRPVTCLSMAPLEVTTNIRPASSLFFQPLKALIRANRDAPACRASFEACAGVGASANRNVVYRTIALSVAGKHENGTSVRVLWRNATAPAGRMRRGRRGTPQARSCLSSASSSPSRRSRSPSRPPPAGAGSLTAGVAGILAHMAHLGVAGFATGSRTAYSSVGAPSSRTRSVVPSLAPSCSSWR